MQTVLAICREHGQAPRWWDGLDRGDQILLLADRRKRLRDEAAAAARGGRRG